MKCKQPKQTFLITILFLSLILQLYVSHVKAETAIVSGRDFQVYFPSTSSLAFQNDLTRIITLEITSGTLNSSSNVLSITERNGRFTFQALQDCQIMLTASIPKETKMGVSGDQNKDSRPISNGETIIVESGNSVIITWNYPLYSYLDYTTLFMGIGGVIMIIFSPMWMIHKIKEKGFLETETIERFGYCLIIFLIGFGLMITWLWG